MPDDAIQVEGERDEPTRPGLRRTVSTQPPPVPDDALSAEGERRKRYVSTLVGHPTGSRPPPVPPNAAPMLAPPKWTGAGPYLTGDEPQPRVSALPAPLHVPLAPVVVAESSRSRITTKVGHVQHLPQPAPADPARQLPPLGDAIQEMLDAQSSVSMEVEEPRADASADDEMPIDDLQIEEILDGLSEADDESPRAHRFGGRGDESTIRHAAPPPADPPAMLTPVELGTPERVADAEADTLRPPPSPSPRQVEPPRAAVQPPSPAAAPSSPRPRRAAIEVGARDLENASSLAPAEVARRPRYRDDSQAGLGVLLLAAMAVIGVGGWFLTRGSYRGPRPAPAQANATEVPATPTKDEPAKPTTAAATSVSEALASRANSKAHAVTPLGAAAADGKQSEQPSGTHQSGQQLDKRATQQKPRTGAKSADEGAVATKPDDMPDDTQPDIAKITKRPDSAELADIPSRDDVLSALAPIRAGVAECAHGQRGVAQLDITVADTGVVTQAIVGGDFAGTAEGSCIARAARSAQFVPFKKPRFRVIYPFSL